MTVEELESVANQGKAFVIGNLLTRTIFNQAMQILFGAIVMIQILAHLPLAQMAELPATASESFEIMQSIVSFDYFQPTDYITIDFTETAPWSEKFDTLGYGSINFVDGMGSILVFCIILVLYAIITAIFSCFGCPCCCRRAKSFLPKLLSQKAL